MNGLWEKALVAAEAARILFAANSYDGACNSAYYAMFNAARALLRQRGDQAADAKRHATVWRQFSLRFSADERFRASKGRDLTRAAEVRNFADYGDTAVSAAVAHNVMGLMEEFMASAEKALTAPKLEDPP